MGVDKVCFVGVQLVVGTISKFSVYEMVLISAVLPQNGLDPGSVHVCVNIVFLIGRRGRTL